MSDNDNLELKKRSRRRLVGAAALALIAAIVLPMVMDDEPVTPLTDIQVTIPERSVDARPIGAREPIVEPVSDLPPDLPPPVEAEPVPPVAEPAPAAEPAPQPAAAPKPAPKPEPAPKPAPKPEPKPQPEPKPAPAPVAEPEESEEARRARAILEGRAPQAAAGETTQLLVQVGAFSDETKARTRQIDLAAKGFASFIETAGGVSRVRMGPFAARAEAEAMIARLRGAGFDGVVTTR